MNHYEKIYKFSVYNTCFFMIVGLRVYFTFVVGDDPADADFDPDYAATRSHERNKVIASCCTMLLNFC